ncbi:MAG: tRNA (adenosine(37)-N6)-threonylcarbamoyltransferase complex transferase subunit TsaD [Candidatus Magasanikbacteria bacterium]
MNILAIETSCDETSLSVICAEGKIKDLQFKIENNLVASQVEVHEEWGGVVPHLATREHEKNLPILFKKLFEDPQINFDDIDRVAVTVGPGLDPCLWAGINFAKKVKKKHFSQSELVGVNHLEGHLYSFLLSQKTNNKFQTPNSKELFPAVHLLVSGGHTILFLMESMTEVTKLGETQDDAAGEAFDKVARLLGLGYPGGPEIERTAKEGAPDSINFPRPMIHSGDFNFSFSGLKTAVLYYLKENFKELKKENVKFNMKKTERQNLAASFQEAVIDTLVSKNLQAQKEFSANSIMLSGGVAANSCLQEKLRSEADKEEISFYTPPIKYDTDNAAMIAVASYINYLEGREYNLESQPNLNISN